MPERVVDLSRALNAVAEEKLRGIERVTSQARLLALNALIESVHAGQHGVGFAVVAREVGEVSKAIDELSTSLTKELAGRTSELEHLGSQLVADVRGTRLADLARNAIEIIDRNLYERSCDVRWWATDSAAVDACADPTEANTRHASHRLGVILDSYTVYLDLWLADMQGRVIANGRPDRYPGVIGLDVSGTDWFKAAAQTRTGEDYAVADIEANAALGGKQVATYAAMVREGGETKGRPIGALGIFFDWEEQASTIVQGFRLSDDEQASTRCLLIDADHRVLAASDGRGLLTERFPLETGGQTQGYSTRPNGDTVGFCLTPGYETYQGLGWYGVLVQGPAGR
jgi:hypothetical protein